MISNNRHFKINRYTKLEIVIDITSFICINMNYLIIM